MTLLGLDIGTTNCKAGLFSREGVVLGFTKRPTPARRHPAGSAYNAGSAYYDPEELWLTVVGAIRDVLKGAGAPRVAAIGIASMAETGLLVDHKTGAPLSPVLPWFDTTAAPQAALLEELGSPLERFIATGLRPSFKTALAKLLWLHEHEPGITAGATWLSAADYIAYRLTGRMATDYSLAGRTYAFRIDKKTWDKGWLSELGLSARLFPPAFPSGAPVGRLRRSQAADLGLGMGTPVAIAGHDHVCAALAAGVQGPGRVFDSLGTAETLIGALPERPLTEADFHSGLMYGCHAAEGQVYWMGGLSTSGGSLEWLGSVLGNGASTYAGIEALLAQAAPGPSGILYFPYLLGSGSPHRDANVRGALVGLQAAHGRSDLLKAVLEGIAYEMEFIRQAGEQVAGEPIEALVAGGGGARLRDWMQIKADVSNCRFDLLAEPEATLLGAALTAGAGCGVFASQAEALAEMAHPPALTILPDPERSLAYRRLYEQGFLPLQEPLRRLSLATK